MRLFTKPPKLIVNSYSLLARAKQADVSEIVQLIEITAFVMEHVSCSPDGIMEWWNIGMLI